MKTETTAPITRQRSTIQLLNDLATQHPELPAAYITVNQPWHGRPSSMDLQLQTPTDFEQWRIALGIAPARVSLHSHGRGSWVEAGTVLESIRISISSHGILITEDQLAAPRTVEAAEVTA